MDRNKLDDLIQEGLSQKKIADRLGLCQSTVVYWLKKYNLETKRRDGRGWGNGGKGRKREQLDNKCAYCGKDVLHYSMCCDNTCTANYKALIFGERWEREGQSALPKSELKTGRLDGYSRRYLFIVNSYKCSRCGWTYDFGDGSFPPLECSHVDGNYQNNNFDNFELLCPNCHAIYTRLNPTERGSGRWLNGVYDESFRNIIGL